MARPANLTVSLVHGDGLVHQWSYIPIGFHPDERCSHRVQLKERFEIRTGTRAKTNSMSLFLDQTRITHLSLVTKNLWILEESSGASALEILQSDDVATGYSVRVMCDVMYADIRVCPHPSNKILMLEKGMYALWIGDPDNSGFGVWAFAAKEYASIQTESMICGSQVGIDPCP
jgi:hypothetical protein